jgi:hypothetical protein
MFKETSLSCGRSPRNQSGGYGVANASDANAAMKVRIKTMRRIDLTRMRSATPSDSEAELE